MLVKPSKQAGRQLSRPDYIVDSVCNVDFLLLQDRGIKAAFIDLDGTVVTSGSFDVDDKLTTYLKAQTLDIYIATNRPKSRDLKNLRQSLHAKDVIHPGGIFAKPLPIYFTRAAMRHHLQPSEVAMIGDRYIQDIFGANLAGLTTILVRKLGKPKGFIDTQLSRLEKKDTPTSWLPNIHEPPEQPTIDSRHRTSLVADFDTLAVDFSIDIAHA